MSPGLTLDTLDGALEPALGSVGAAHRHAVLFDPDAMASIIADASRRGARLSPDAVLVLDGARLRRHAATPRDDGAAFVEEVESVDERFLREVGDSLTEFDVDDPGTTAQLMAIERDVLLPAGKRWFRVRLDGRTAALGSLLALGREALVDHVVTLPFARRRGFAAAVVSRMASESASLGVSAMLLTTEPGGAAQRVYERLGFRRVRTIVSLRERRALASARLGG